MVRHLKLQVARSLDEKPRHVSFINALLSEHLKPFERQCVAKMCIRLLTLFNGCEQHLHGATHQCQNWQHCQAEPDSVRIQYRHDSRPCVVCHPANASDMPPHEEMTDEAPQPLNPRTMRRRIYRQATQLSVADFDVWLAGFCQEDARLRMGVSGVRRSEEELAASGREMVIVWYKRLLGRERLIWGELPECARRAIVFRWIGDLAENDRFDIAITRICPELEGSIRRAAAGRRASASPRSHRG